MRALILIALLCSASPVAQSQATQSKRILYITHSAGFRHGSIEHSIDVLRTLAATASIEITATEDLSRINAANLANYDAILFFTSGELPIDDQQKADLLAFIRSGKGFGGFHSATDTFYQWPEYGEMIGGYFNGHPWTHEVTITVESRPHPLIQDLGERFRITDEIYQFRNFAASGTRVLLKLDPSSVNLNTPGVNPNTTDFPLAWTRSYGQGRVFYSALGHFDDVWDHTPYRDLLRKALQYLVGAPQMLAGWIGNAATFDPLGYLAPGSAFTIFGENLTPGATSAAPDPGNLPLDLAGTTLVVEGRQVPLYYASPTQINAYLPLDVPPWICTGMICSGFYYHLLLNSGGLAAQATVRMQSFTPGVFTTTREGNYIVVWGTGFGAVERRGELDWLVNPVHAQIASRDAAVRFAGLAPGWPGLYQINVEVPAGTDFPAHVRLDYGNWTQSLQAP